jgi:hypothetical protein
MGMGVWTMLMGEFSGRLSSWREEGGLLQDRLFCGQPLLTLVQPPPSPPKKVKFSRKEGREGGREEGLAGLSPGSWLVWSGVGSGKG